MKLLHSSYFLIILLIITVTQGALYGIGDLSQIGKGSFIFDAKSPALLDPVLIFYSRVIACAQSNIILTADGRVLITGIASKIRAVEVEITAPSLRGVRIVNAACADYYQGIAYLLQGANHVAYMVYPFNFINTYPFWQGDANVLSSGGGTLTGYPIRKVVAGGRAFGVIYEIGRVELWGYNDDNKFGHNRDGSPALVNVTAPGGGQVPFGDAALADRHSLLCSFDGIVYGAGYGVGGLLFTGGDSVSSTFIPWAYTATYRCLRVFATRNNSFVLTTEGQLIGVGDQSSGQLGVFGSGNAPFPLLVLGGARPVLDFAVGQSGDNVYGLASLYDSDVGQTLVYCWGSSQAAAIAGFSGMQLTTPSECSYLNADLQGRQPIALSASGSHSTVTVSTGYLTWSVDYTGFPLIVLIEDLLFSSYDRYAPSDIRDRISRADDFVIIKTAPIPNPPSYGLLRFTEQQEIYRWGRGYADPTSLEYTGTLPIKTLAVGSDHALFIDTDGMVFAHGLNNFGQIGDPSILISTELTVVLVPGILAPVISVSATNTASFAVLDSGQLLWWGTLPAGIFPHVTALAQNQIPTSFDLVASGIFSDPAPLLSAVYVAAEAFVDVRPTMFLVTQSNDTYSFGSNQFGRLCRNLTAESVPSSQSAGQVLLPPGYVVDDIVQGQASVYVLTTNGSVLGCGFNGHQIIASQGIPCSSSELSSCPVTTSSILSPQTITHEKPVNSITASQSALYGISADRRLVTAYGGVFTRFIEGHDDWWSRKWTTVAAVGKYFVGAAPLEGYSLNPSLPRFPAEISMWGRGFRVSDVYDESVLRDLKIDMWLSGGEISSPFSCTPLRVFAAADGDKKLTCKPALFSAVPGYTLSAELVLRGERSARFVVSVLVNNPSVQENDGTSYAVHSGTRIMPIYGSYFGTATEDLEVYFYFDSEFRATAEVVSVNETQINAQITIPTLREDAPIRVDVYRLTARHQDTASYWGTALMPWSIENRAPQDNPTPSNARSVYVSGTGILSNPQANQLRFRILDESLNVRSDWSLCSGVEVVNVTAGQALSCVLSANLTQFFNATGPSSIISLELSRGRVTSTAVVGRVGPPLEFRPRSSGAKFAQKASIISLESPTPRTQFLAAFGTSLFSQRLIQGTITIGSGKRVASAVNVTSSATCVVDGFLSESLMQCTVQGIEPIQWADGSATLALSVPAFGLSANLFVGDTVPAVSLLDNSNGKIALARGTLIDISGSWFATGPFATTDNSVTLSLGQSPAQISCSVISATNETVICSVASDTSASVGTSIFARVTTWGYTQLAYVGSVVPKPSVFVQGDAIIVGETTIYINGSNFADDIRSVRVRLYQGDAGLNNVTYSYCDVSSQSSSANGIACRLPDTSLVSSVGSRITISVYSNGAWSDDYTVIVSARPTGNTPSEASAITQNNTTGLAVGLTLAIVAVALLVLLVFFLRHRRRLKDIKGEMLQVPAAFANMFNIKTSDLEIVRKLGEGSFGAVFLATFKTPKGKVIKVAVKKLTSSMLASSVDGFFREATLMMSIAPHKNVVRIWGLCQEPNNFSLVMQYYEKGSLDTYSKKAVEGSGWDPHELYRIVLGIARGMAHLSTAGIVHRDLAARNILLAKSSEPKVSDFGMSRVLNSDSDSAQTSSNVGPVRWMSPENIASRTYSEKSDVWSYGALLFELITGHEPHKGEDLIEVAVSIRDHARNPISQIPVDCVVPRYISKLMKRCFKKNPEDRPSFKEIVTLLEENRPSDYDSDANQSEDEVIIFGEDKQKTRKTKSKRENGGKDTNEDTTQEMMPVESEPTSPKYAPISDGSTPKNSRESISKQAKVENPTTV